MSKVEREWQQASSSINPNARKFTFKLDLCQPRHENHGDNRVVKQSVGVPKQKQQFEPSRSNYNNVTFSTPSSDNYKIEHFFKPDDKLTKPSVATKTTTATASTNESYSSKATNSNNNNSAHVTPTTTSGGSSSSSSSFRTPTPVPASQQVNQSSMSQIFNIFTQGKNSADMSPNFGRIKPIGLITPTPNLTSFARVATSSSAALLLKETPPPSASQQRHRQAQQTQEAQPNFNFVKAYAAATPVKFERSFDFLSKKASSQQQQQQCTEKSTESATTTTALSYLVAKAEQTRKNLPDIFKFDPNCI